MWLNILPIRERDGARIEFDYPLDLSELELYGECPIPEPVRVHGFAEQRANVLMLHAECEYDVHSRCARCLKPVTAPTVRYIDRPMADSVADEDDDYADEIILIENDGIDLDEVAREAVILEAEYSYLCSEDCKGLCPTCGADLNEGPCSCKKEVDERFAALADLLRNNE